MATSTIKQNAAWTQTTLATLTYGTLVGWVNTALHMAFIRWSGNNNVPSESTVNVTIPSAFKPSDNMITTMRSGDAIEVRLDGTVRLMFGANPVYWTGAQIGYVTQ